MRTDRAAVQFRCADAQHLWAGRPGPVTDLQLQMDVRGMRDRIAATLYFERRTPPQYRLRLKRCTPAKP